MHAGLKTVIELQQLDTQIAEYSAQIDLLPKQVQTLETQLYEFIHAHEERKQRLTQNQKERKDLEAEIQAIRARIARHKDQLYEVKTNEQYKMMLKEIGGEEEKVRGFEDRILEKMVEAEDLENHIRDAAARLDSEKARVAGEVQELQSLRQVDVDERSQLQSRRDGDAASIEPQLLADYERLRRGKRGLAVTQVRNGMCAACNVMLRPQLLNDVRTNEVVVTCENCGRILYFVAPPVVIEQGVLRITKQEFEKLRELHRIRLWTWPAVFSSNHYRQIWSPVGRGYTHLPDRDELRGLSAVLDAVADAYLEARPAGGRFFINEEGVFYNDAEVTGASPVQFLALEISDE